jgi:hypothetical protein
MSTNDTNLSLVRPRNDGTYYKTAFATCCGCGVMFVDAEKFADPKGLSSIKTPRREPPGSRRRTEKRSLLEAFDRETT